jgi:hypothetical protein
MGKLDLDCIERLLVPEWQNDDSSGNTREREALRMIITSTVIIFVRSMRKRISAKLTDRNNPLPRYTRILYEAEDYGLFTKSLVPKSASLSISGRVYLSSVIRSTFRIP